MNTPITEPKQKLSKIKSYVTEDSTKFSEIFDKNINITIWNRKLNSLISDASEHLLKSNPQLQFSEILEPQNVVESLKDKFGSKEDLTLLYNDISRLVNTFCDLFVLNKAWLRLDAIDHPMCPRFHTDLVVCRLVTTYLGPATQWLPHHLVNRTKLGYGNEGKSDEESGLFKDEDDIEQLEVGNVALLKGEGWKGNEGFGLVHRSPKTKETYHRLYLTIDFEELYNRVFKVNAIK